MNGIWMSEHFRSRKPSAIRLAQIEFAKRKDNVREINTAIGNVSLPMHPLLQKRMFSLNSAESPFNAGVVKYSATVGMPEARDAFLNIIRASGCSTDRLFAQITDGGSQAMELLIIGCCGPAGTDEKPLLLIDAAYTNYKAMASRLGRSIISIARRLEDNGKFTLPELSEIKKIIAEKNPGAIVVIPYDNPTGHFYDHSTMVELGKLCVEKNIWMISDEAYRELFYTGSKPSSIWALTEEEVPGITGRRISIETSSKVWNACGLRIGALVTDSQEFHEKSVAENTANLCSNVIGQYIFGALAHESAESLQGWFSEQREYYKSIMGNLTSEIRNALPGIVVSSPDASIYSVVDVRNIAKPGFDAGQFALYCAQKGSIDVDGTCMTLLVSPMSEFYSTKPGQANPGDTQMRIAYVASPEEMQMVPMLFAALFKCFELQR